MKRFWGWVCLSLWSMGALAQHDSVVMKVNGRTISRAEFEYSYFRHRMIGERLLSPKEYADVWATRLLQVEAAKEAKLDTTQAFRRQHEAMRKQQLASCLVDTLEVDSCLRARNGSRTSRSVQIQVQQIFKSLPQHVLQREVEVQKKCLDSLYQVICKQPEADFAQWVDAFSDDKEIRWISPLQETVEFEKAVYSLSKGEVSPPFFTPEGIHMVKVLDVSELTDEELVATQRREWLQRNTTLDAVIQPMVDRLLKEGNYVPNQTGMNELLKKGQTIQPLFVLGGKEYTGRDFSLFAQSYPAKLKWQLALFIAKSAWDEVEGRIEQLYPEVRWALQALDEAYLIKEIGRLQVDVPAETDLIGQRAYFEVHRSKYRWKNPHFKGAVLHCVDKKTAKRVKKRLKKIPFTEWETCLQQAFEVDGVKMVKMVQGVFAEGVHPSVDQHVFKKGKCTPDLSYPFTVVVGKKLKEPEQYTEVIEAVKKDYRAFLYERWQKKLKATFKVEIMSDVLKTVNNN